MTIQIPKGMKVSTKGSTGDEISIEYEVLNDTDAKIAYNKSWQAIMFEDTRSGDYDYNDLIIHVRNLHSWNKLLMKKDLSIHKVICNRSVIAWNAVSTMNWKKGKMNMLVSPGLLK